MEKKFKSWVGKDIGKRMKHKQPCDCDICFYQKKIIKDKINKKENNYRYSEVVDSPENARKFIDLNQIKQKQIIGIIVIWDEKNENN